ncbi:MAG: FkbM family methyltransferase [Leptospiraceae bacterium]|nr:FkbM family methyltransferase [Leptospiraceae bacterium]
MKGIGFIKKIIQKILRKFRLKLLKIGPYSIFDFESFLYRYLAVHKTLTFIQIGANDGIMNDPIYQFNVENKDVVSGFVIEPLPDIFEKLVKNYKKCPGIKPFNLAIHSTKKEMILHRVKPEYADKVPAFARGIASFDSSHWKKTDLVPSEDYMEQVKVKCVSFSDFMKSNSIKNLDLLLLDTEGYDFEILMSIDFKKIKPRIIRFEHGVRNQVMTTKKFIQICDHLNSNGYQIIAESYDATAYLLNPKDLIF